MKSLIVTSGLPVVELPVVELPVVELLVAELLVTGLHVAELLVAELLAAELSKERLVVLSVTVLKRTDPPLFQRLKKVDTPASHPIHPHTDYTETYNLYNDEQASMETTLTNDNDNGNDRI